VAFEAKILADSISPSGHRLTTFELTFPRVILAEFNTHRMLSRNAASSRAIPTEKLIQRVLDDPFVPDFRLNQKGMQAGEVLADEDAEQARAFWINQRNQAVSHARTMHGLEVHKQYVNRLLEPWMWCTVIASATDWANLFHLRCDPQAEPSFQTIAGMAKDLYLSNEPREIGYGEWHLPLTDGDDFGNLPDIEIAKVSVGRCARVSYLTHDGKRDIAADIELHDRLAASGHWSPFEHVAMPHRFPRGSGNFLGWEQYRKRFQNENVTTI
jgi:thymidylate synthase ThyX